ncbi:reprolysin-like metallopeptidase [Collimonas sp. H4R21]|uniref:Reprolysin-like metallopeptidase n=1 Tax=Collimonas rhizosphaerae TaxID=3126357 RepID=A0ABU9PYN9_9BURK
MQIKKYCIFPCVALLLSSSLLVSTVFAADTRTLWHDLPQQRDTTGAARIEGSTPTHFRVLTLDFSNLKSEATAIATNIPGVTARSGNVNTRLSLPLPEGGFTEFTLSDSAILPPDLAQRYPEIRSYKGSDGKGRNLRLDISPQGMKAMVYEQDGAWLVQPAETLAGNVTNAKASGAQYWSFRRKALPASAQPFQENVFSGISSSSKLGAAIKSTNARLVTGNIRRDYRIAIAATSSYTAKFGGTVVGGLAAVSYMLNRVNEIYEKDLGVHLTLVSNNDKIIYTDPAKDPYSSGQNILRQNVDNLNKVIGSRNFDIGHVVDTGSGGVVGRIGSTCLDLPDEDNKAAGTTGRNNPVGDAFYIDYVAHELGHQFGAWHTYNSCNHATSTLVDSALEPGSGSTIMGYAGICLPNENLQSNSDPYFHAVSREQIHAWISSKGGECAVKRINPNNAPWIDPKSMPGGGFKTLTIPAKTPFVLKGIATGNPDAIMTYTWEQFDAGPIQGAILKDDSKGPIFRSMLPNTSGERVFPRLAAVLGEESLGNGEVYPTTNRKLQFRLTARDNLDTEATTASADVTINVIKTPTPFGVTIPSNIEVLSGGSMQTIGWNVARTNEAPISCAQVRIDLSVDGGHTYLPKPLAASVPNIGNASVMLPRFSKSTSRARIKISCVDSIFFAVSPVNFTIQ